MTAMSDEPVSDEQPARTLADVERERRLVAARDRHDRNLSMIDHGKRMAGPVGGVMAAAMIAIRDVYEPARDDTVVAISETPDEPHDVDRDGVHLRPEEVGAATAVTVPALPRRAPVGTRRRARRR